MKRKIKFILWKGRDGWRWHAKRSGRIVAESGEAYSSKSKAHRAVITFTDALSADRYEIVEPK
jgi:uncharacterized protein YegP (UPF0339 family)